MTTYSKSIFKISKDGTVSVETDTVHMKDSKPLQLIEKVYDDHDILEPELNVEIKCMEINSEVNVVKSNGNKYVFNGETTYNSSLKNGLYNGSYIFKNVSIDHPMAILNNGMKDLISYNGDESKKLQKEVDGNLYDFYYGDINVNVVGDFNEVSIYCYIHGYMGGENLLVYTSECIPPSEPEPRACCMALTASCLACAENISVEEYCKKNPNTVGCEEFTKDKVGLIGPAWTYDPSVEKPAGEKNMGTYTIAVYTKEQQERLGVNELGEKVEPSKKNCPLVIDVRTKEEVKDGAISCSHNLEIHNDPSLISEVLKLADNNKNKEIIVYCKSGNRAQLANDILKKNGFLNVTNVGGYNKNLEVYCDCS